MASLHVQSGFAKEKQQRKISRNTAKSFSKDNSGSHVRILTSALTKDGRSRRTPQGLYSSFGHHDSPARTLSNDLSVSISRDDATKRGAKDISSFVSSGAPTISIRSYQGQGSGTRHSHDRDSGRRTSAHHEQATVANKPSISPRASRDELMVPRSQTYVGKSNRKSKVEKLGKRHKTAVGSFRRRLSFDFYRQRNPKAKEKFRHSVRLILILLRWVAEITKNSAKHNRFMDQLNTFSEMAQAAYNTEDLRNANLAFDVSYFKANKDINLSAEVKEILSLPPAARTKEQLQTVLFGLQHLRSFAEYPLHMQEKLCRVAWYERVPPRRVIIRQGHTAENFYFILSGKAIVKRAETNPVTGEAIIRTAAVMTKGMSFGELALLHHSRRTATVVSHDTTQLLTIARRDFMDIFMGGTAAGHVPDHIKFVNSLEFMKDWPLENLLEHPEYCLFHFFKRGVVIVKDSRESDWLYIVKSGACQVMKQLKAATPSPICKNKTKKIDLSLELPKLGTGEQSPRIEDGRKRSVFPPVPLELKTAMSEFASSTRKTNVTDGDDDSNLNDSQTNLPRISIDDPQSDTKKQKTSTVKVPDIFHQTALKTAGSRPGFSRSKFIMATNKRRGSFNKSSSPDVIKDVSDSANSTPEPRSPTGSKTEKENTPSSVFVQVQLLKPRDVFGLTSVQFDDDVPVSETSVSLVSRGAECIMLSKQFFMRHANEKVRMELRRQVRPYPTADTFQENLQIKVDWDNYRRELLKDITTQHEVQVTGRKSAR